MLSIFLTLPVEVIDGVTNLLDCTDLCAVRLASKVLYQRTHDHFGRTCFSVLQTDLSLNNLQTLWAISQTEHLKQYVQALFIREQQHKFGKGFLWHRVKANPRADLDTRLSLGVQVLRDILRNLTNCRSFQILIPELGGAKEHHQSKGLKPCDTVHIVFEVVIEIGIPVKSLRINYFHYQDLATERLQKQLYQQSKYMAAWGKLEELRFERCPAEVNLGWTRDLILHNTHLKKLVLQLNNNHITQFLASILCSKRSCQGLQAIELNSMTATRKILSTLLLRCRSSLRKLSICYVGICHGTWVQILTELRSFESLEYMAIETVGQMENGKPVHLQFPALEANRVVPGSDGQKFALGYQEWGGKKRVWSATYRGRVGMDKALEMLAESAEDSL